MLIGKHVDEMDNKNIWDMSLRGIDPKQVPQYKRKLEEKEIEKRKKQKQYMGKKEVDNMNNLFKLVKR